MDTELSKNLVTEEDNLQQDADFDGSALEGEKCGICMDVVIDRGVLNCCQHWFCFVCIDNWSAITNLCPLCQNEFQMITCVPVYDTIGSKRADEDSGSRDDEWSVEGKTNTLSFPSYYIDENAVTCLDDGCKIRSGSITPDESSSLDTSIACDSCDIWYHAFCVGFDPEGTSVELWLCPRCITDETQRSGLNSLEAVQVDNQSKKYEYEHLGAAMFSGKVSVSVADDGETALVVSMIDQKQFLEDPSEDITSTSVFNKEHNFIPSVSGIDSPSAKYEEISRDHEIKTPQSKGEAASDAVMTSSYGEEISESKVKTEIISRSSSLEASGAPTEFNKCSTESDLKAHTYKNTTDLGNNNGIMVDHLVRDSSADGINVKAEDSARTCGKRKRKDHGETSDCSKDQKKCRPQTDALQPKSRSDQATQRTAVVTSEHLEHDYLKKISASDIMSIVQDTESSLAESDQIDLMEGKKDMSAGIRMKKIVRRPVKDKDSSSLVQKLRKEIREVVKNKNQSSQDVGQSIFDPKLLAAFRTAVSVPEAKSGKRISSSVVKAKNIMFKKGKTRENLTKKIFSTSSGKRKQSWHRDCQVEFWRRHCLNKTANPEKVETLKSVLNLLKTGPNPAIWEQNIEEEGTNPILSRLYLADASVLPRKDNAKSVSTVEDASRPGEDQVSASAEEEVKVPDNHQTGNQDRHTASISLLDSTKKKSTPSSLRSGVASSSVDEPIVNPPKLKVGKSDEVVDKRKWALEILARKTATSSTTAANQKHEGDAALKGKYPLLAQLPGDMKPKLAPCRHKNIPNSVRQAQLYRLAEQFLKLTNVSPMRKTGATELAVADAINIENEVANKSNSKVVYLNLVSQELRNRCNTKSSDLVEDSSNPPASETNSLGGGDTSGPLPPASLDPEVQEALRNAGLLFDSPPNSPNHQADKLNENGDTSMAAKWEEEEGPDDILEMNPNPEIDIYGDFEYDLEDEDYMGATSIEVSNLKNIGEEESKVKVVFSTLGLDRPNSGLESENAEKHDPKNENEDALQLPPSSADEDGAQEPSVDEYEELYGQDKEPPSENHSLPPQGMKSSSGDKSEKVIPRSSDINGPSATSEGGNSQDDSRRSEKKKGSHHNSDKEPGAGDSILKKVEAYIKEHIRPLCKSGVITVDQYRWAVTKTAEKVMKYHSKAKNATFLIKEGEKVKKLADQYVEAAAQKKQESK